MPEYAENTVYLKMGSVVVDTYFREVNLTPSNAAVDTTAGAGVRHTKRQPGLNDTSISITLAYDTEHVPDYIRKIKPGQVIEIEYGSEGNVSGKPRHLQDFVITSAAHAVSVDKSAVSFTIQGEGAEEPVYDMHDGAVYP